MITLRHILMQRHAIGKFFVCSEQFVLSRNLSKQDLVLESRQKMIRWISHFLGLSKFCYESYALENSYSLGSSQFKILLAIDNSLDLSFLHNPPIVFCLIDKRIFICLILRLILSILLFWYFFAKTFVFGEKSKRTKFVVLFLAIFVLIYIFIANLSSTYVHRNLSYQDRQLEVAWF